jgi:murein DD-endopeptidase MepM/ murein hydrolase activator NlpD
MRSLDDLPPRSQVSSPARHANGTARWERIAIPGLAVSLIGIAAIVAIVAVLALVSKPALSPVAAAPSLSPTATVTPSPTPTDSPTPVPTPKPTPAYTGPPTPMPVAQMTGYVWPLDNPIITLPFGPSSWGEFIVNGKLFHDGVDMASKCGDRVMAAHDGKVLAAGMHYDDFIGWQGGSLYTYYHRMNVNNWWNTKTVPLVVILDDGDGYRSIYAHESKLIVKVGQMVKAGQVIGYEGATGNANGCHVHFGLFNTLETATFANLPSAINGKNKLPPAITARINPLLVLPYRDDVAEMRTLRPQDAAAWASAHPSTSPGH